MGLSPNGNGGTGAPILARVVINATAIDAKALMAAAINTGRCRVHVGRPTRHYEFLHAKKFGEAGSDRPAEIALLYDPAITRWCSRPPVCRRKVTSTSQAPSRQRL